MQNNHPLTLALIKHAYVFYICAKHLNFTKAGEELHLTQSAISKSIKKLEDSLDTKLFTRKQNHITLSQKGVKFFENIQCLCLELSEQISNTSLNYQSDTIAFSTIPSCANFWLNKIITEFSTANEHTKIKINIYNNTFSTSMLANNLTICCLKNTDHISDDYMIIKLFEEDLVPICTPSVAAQYPNTTDLILNSDLIVHSSRENLWHPILAEFNIKFQSLNTHLELEHYYMIIEAALQGKAIGLAPREYVKNHLKNNELVIPFLPKFISPYNYYLCTHKNNLLNSANLKFVNWYKKARL